VQCYRQPERAGIELWRRDEDHVIVGQEPTAWAEPEEAQAQFHRGCDAAATST